MSITANSQEVMEEPGRGRSGDRAAHIEHAQTLSLNAPTGLADEDDSLAKEALFITPNDAVVGTRVAGRLPPVPIEQAEKLNALKAKVDERGKNQHGADGQDVSGIGLSKEVDGSITHRTSEFRQSPEPDESDRPLGTVKPPRTTNPLFPPLPLYGPSSFTRDLQCYTFRATSCVLSLTFLIFIFTGGLCGAVRQAISGRKEQERPFYEEEVRRQRIREADETSWNKRQRRNTSPTRMDDTEEEATQDPYIPTVGGKDPIICDVAYYARREGLDMEEYKVQTEDGFIIDLWHIYNPLEYAPKSAQHRSHKGPNVLKPSAGIEGSLPARKYPILMLHGLLQSSGAFCTNDSGSLAFYLCKSGYDVWLGNNRCGFNPEHTSLKYSDPRMWNWNIRQMGILDLPALISRVLHETIFGKLALVAHSQGTAQTLVALAKDQRPEIGDKISVFCALAPAAYAGPLLDTYHIRWFRVLSDSMYKFVFGIHAFIPIMLFMHQHLPTKFYGKVGYYVFSFLFGWDDGNWDRGLRDRMFRFAPVYVSSEAMRWWLGRGGFAKQRCVLAEREEWAMEDVDEEAYDSWALSTSGIELPKQHRSQTQATSYTDNSESTLSTDQSNPDLSLEDRRNNVLLARQQKAWYDSRSPPMAFWVAGNDNLVDGRRLLRRFDHARGIEPHVRVVHSKVIENYQHLDVIWAIDCVEQVGKEVRDVIWSACDGKIRAGCRVPVGAEEVGVWEGLGR